MIRIYLDWNVVSNLKKPEFKELKEFFDRHKEYLLFPYSPAHFSDLMKSYSPENQYFNQDLEMLQYLSDKHLIRWVGNRTEPLFGSPDEYFEGEKNNSEDVFELMNMENLFSKLDEMSEEVGLGKLGTILKSIYKLQPSEIEVNDVNREIMQKMFPSISSNSNKWDIISNITLFARKFLQDKEFYKDFRKSIGEQGFRVEANAGNWHEQEVIDNIDKFLKEIGADLTFIEYIETTFKYRKEPINIYEFYTTAYLMLDMIGYQSDKLPKSTDNMQNIQTDGEHSFYAAHCDFFVVGDKKLRVKSKVLYNKLKIPTMVVQPNELIEELKKVIYQFPENGDFISEIFDLIKNNEIVESYPSSEDHEAESYVIKLPIFYFNFFNYVVYSYYPSRNGVVLTFKKAFINYSDFVYYSEVEKLIDSVVSVFGYNDKEKLEEIKQEMMYGDKECEMLWSLNKVVINLEKDEDTKTPILTYFFALNNELEKENND